MSCENESNPVLKRAYWGAILIAAGSLLLGNNLGLLPFVIPAYVFSWKMLLVLIGFSFVLFGRFGGVIPLFAGLYFILPEAFGIQIPGVHQLWPVLIILIGLMVIFKKKNHNSQWRKKKEFMKRYMEADNTAETKAEPEEGVMDATAIFGSQTKKVSAYDFKRGKCTAIFGGLEIDLTNCYLSKEKVVIDVTAVFGGITLKVPKEWNVKSEIVPVMGGIEDEVYNLKNNYVDPAAELTLRGSVIMGGVEIIRE